MKILLIRTDFIGDLVLTTPLIATLAQRHHVDILVNPYSQGILAGNPHIRKIHIYTKFHLRAPGQSQFNVLLNRVKTMINIRRANYDAVIVVREKWGKHPLFWAKVSGAKRVIAFGTDAPDCVTDKIPEPEKKGHLVELLNKLTQPLGFDQPPGKLQLFVDKSAIEQAFKHHAIDRTLPVYGLQISARKVQQRWPETHFIELAHRLMQQEKCQILLFWSPGKAENLHYPGGDDIAARIVAACRGIHLIPIRTVNLQELMVSMSLCDLVITSDGGAMHVAAGVGKPIIALFGNSDPVSWAPWQVPHIIIADPDQTVSNISVDEVYKKFVELRDRVKQVI